MGTNFYWLDPVRPEVLRAFGNELTEDNSHLVHHIGKRSACGLYCFSCGVTLCVEGEKKVHQGNSAFLKACPKCGGTLEASGYDGAFVELGMQKIPNPPEKPAGVHGASSFSWAQDPENMIIVAIAHSDETLIRDEYGRTYTVRQFLNMVTTYCPIRFYDSIGRVFW